MVYWVLKLMQHKEQSSRHSTTVVHFRPSAWAEYSDIWASEDFVTGLHNFDNGTFSKRWAAEELSLEF